MAWPHDVLDVYANCAVWAIIGKGISLTLDGGGSPFL
jgi:hypothetical protein